MRVRVRCQYTLQDTLRRRVFTYQSDDGLSYRGAAPSADRPRDGSRARGRVFFFFFHCRDVLASACRRSSDR